MKRIILLLLIIILCPVVTLAQEDDASISVDMDENVLDVEIIADTNIRNSFIVNHNNGLFNIDFDVINDWHKTQPNIKYAVELYRVGDDDKRLLMDRVVYDDMFDLAPQQQVHKSALYSMPQSIPIDEEYDVQIVLSCSDGLLLSFLNVGRIAKETQNGIYIDPATCYLRVNDEKFSLMQGVDVAQNEQLILACDRVVNVGDTTTQLQMKFLTKNRTSFGDVVSLDDKNDEIWAAQQSKSISYEIAKPTQPQAYEGSFAFFDGGNKVSNDINVHYVVQGDSATIQNAVTDKDYYQQGETAHITVFITGRASVFPGSRDLQNIQDIHDDMQDMGLEVSLTDGRDQLCGEKFSDTINGNSENAEVQIAVHSACNDPKVHVVVKNHNGMVLDEAVFAITTISQKPNVSKKVIYATMMITVLKWIIIIMPFVVLIGYAVRKKFFVQKKTNIGIFFAMMFLCGGMFLHHSHFVDAAAFATGSYHCFTYKGEKGYCTVNGTYDVTAGDNCSQNTKATASMQWGACSNMTIDANLYINDVSVWDDQSKDTDYKEVQYASGDSGLQESNLGILATGSHEIPFKMTFFHDWHDWDFNEKTETIKASKSVTIPNVVSNGRCGTWNNKTGTWAEIEQITGGPCATGSSVTKQVELIDNTYSWECSGACGTTATCTATLPKINGACQTNTTQGTYACDAKDVFDTQSELCARGLPTVSQINLSNVKPGETVSWGCNGAQNGTSTASDACKVTKAPVQNSECGTWNNKTGTWAEIEKITGGPCAMGSSVTKQVELIDNTYYWECTSACGTPATCTATLPKMDGACTDAVGEYDWDAKEFRNVLLCQNGAKPIPPVIKFPAEGETVAWDCEGMYGGIATTNQTCKAKRKCPSIACGTLTQSDTKPSSKDDVCAKPGLLNGNSVVFDQDFGKWTWSCVYKTTDHICEGEKCEAKSCLADRPFDLQNSVYFGSDGKPNNANITMTNCLIPNTKVCCTIDGQDLDKKNDQKNSICTGESGEIQVTPGELFTAECWFDKNNDKKKDDDKENRKFSNLSVQTMCASRSCNTQGRCQATPQAAMSVDDCSNTCSSDADCSTGRMIETRP